MLIEPKHREKASAKKRGRLSADSLPNVLTAVRTEPGCEARSLNGVRVFPGVAGPVDLGPAACWSAYYWEARIRSRTPTPAWVPP